MTTYYEKIYQFGQKLADNLTSMGVDASFEDGGLTLASKISNVNKFKQGVLLTTDKLIGQIGDTINLTTLYLENDECVSGKTIEFSPISSTDTTDNYGIATTHYTCTGSGIVEFVAEQGNIQSKTLEVIDALFYDTAIDGSENTHYYYNANAITMDADIDGTTIENSDTTAKYVYAIPSNETLGTGKYYSPSFIVEVDLVGEHSNNCYMRISDASNNYYYSFGNLDNSFHHLKYVITPTTQRLFIDGSTTSTYSKSYELGNCSIFFTLGGSASLKFKNLKIYPIE